MLIAPTIAETDISTMIVSSVGSDGIMVHNQRSSEVSSKDLGFITGGSKYNAITAGKQIVSLGKSTYGETAITDNSYGNVLDIQTSLDARDANGYVISDSYTTVKNVPNVPDIECTASNVGEKAVGGTVVNNTTITGSLPSYQTAEVAYTVHGNQGTYDSSTFIEDANMSTDMYTEGDSGVAITYHYAEVKTGFNKSEPVMNFRKEDYGHDIAIGSYEGYFNQTFNWQYKDTSTPFQGPPT